MCRFPNTKGKVTIIGCGLIGASWATLFCSAGYQVCLYDVGEAEVAAGRDRVAANLRQLKEDGLSRGTLSPDEALSLISTSTVLSEALTDAIYAQESTVERVDFRLKLYAELDAAAPPDCILASSSSTIPASSFTEHLENRSRCLIVHPVNPPLLIPLTEIVPAPWTADAIAERAVALMKDIGQAPIRLRREVVGFGVNRLQFALIAEAWRLVADGVLSPDDVDKIMTSGLGLRYAFYGPFEVMHLNAAGIEDYCRRYAGGLRNVIADFGPNPTFEEPVALEALKEYLNGRHPISELAAVTAERDARLTALTHINNKLKKD